MTFGLYCQLFCMKKYIYINRNFISVIFLNAYAFYCAANSKIFIFLYLLNYLTENSEINMKSLSGVAETDFPAISASSLNILKINFIKMIKNSRVQTWLTLDL